MNRDQKATAIAEIAANIDESQAVFAVDYRGISVPQVAELRAKLRESEGGAVSTGVRQHRDARRSKSADRATRIGYADWWNRPGLRQYQERAGVYEQCPHSPRFHREHRRPPGSTFRLRLRRFRRWKDGRPGRRRYPVREPRVAQ